MKTSVVELKIKDKQNKIKSNEYKSILIFCIIFIAIFLFINDVKKFEPVIHGMHLAFLIGIGLIILNNSNFDFGILQKYYGIVSIFIGLVESICVYGFVTTGKLQIVPIDLSITIISLSVFAQMFSLFVGSILINKDLNLTKTLYIYFGGIIIFGVLIFLLKIYFDSLMASYYPVILISSILSIFFAIIIFGHSVEFHEKLDEEEILCCKRMVIILLISLIPKLFHPIIKDFYVEDSISKMINNLTMYYLYRYIIYITIKKTYTELSYTHDELRHKTEMLQEKNKKLILETRKIATLKKELMDEEERLQYTLDVSNNGIVVYNSKKNISFTNLSFDKAFKFEKDEEKLNEIIEDYEMFLNEINNVMDNKCNKFIYISTTDKRIFEVNILPISIHESLQGILCVFKDRTLKKESEEKIFKANYRYERFLESVGDGIVVIKEGKVIYKNTACKNIFKENIDEIDFAMLVKRKNSELMYRIGKNVIFIEIEYAKYKDGNNKKVEILSIRDITNRKMDNLKLEDTKASYSKFIDILPDGICLLDRDFKITYANNSMLNIVELDNFEQIKGKDFRSYIDDNKSELKIDDCLRNINTKDKVFKFLEFGLILGGEVKKNIEINVVPFNMSEENATIIIVKDLIHKRDYELIEAELLERFKADKIKTEFFANMSHELKTPLNVIYSSNQLVDSFYRNDKIIDYNDNLKGHIDLVRQSSFRLQRLINNIIDLTKMESGCYNLKFSIYNVVEVVEDLFMRTEKYAQKKGLSIVFDTEYEEIVTYIDKLEFERTLLNLLSNCIKFTNNGGSIFIDITLEGRNVVISVKDTGVGIPSDKLEIIFEEFSQVDKTLSRNAEGSGIGLSIVKNLIELHGGSIEVFSEENEGTEFRLKLPLKTPVYEKSEEDRRIYNIDERINIEFSDIYYY